MQSKQEPEPVIALEFTGGLRELMAVGWGILHQQGTIVE
jgi:hypothetical protein